MSWSTPAPRTPGDYRPAARTATALDSLNCNGRNRDGDLTQEMVDPVPNFGKRKNAMGLRMRKSFTLIPGVRMTISNSGVSYSAGVRGARITRTARGNINATVGLPGSGISYNTSIGGRSARSRNSSGQAVKARSGFVNLTRADGILPHYSDDQLVARANRISSALAKGASPRAILISEIMCKEFSTAEEACSFVKRAVVAFCPDRINQILAACSGDPAVRQVVSFRARLSS